MSLFQNLIKLFRELPETPEKHIAYKLLEKINSLNSCTDYSNDNYKLFENFDLNELEAIEMADLISQEAAFGDTRRVDVIGAVENIPAIIVSEDFI